MIINKLSKIMESAFVSCGYDKSYGRVVESGRPDLCQFQCNGSMPAAKEYRKAPFMIAEDVVNKIKEQEDYNTYFNTLEVVRPGFINIICTDEFISNNISELKNAKNLGVSCNQNHKIVIDYGGPNVAKPLHVGHLRAAIIGESIKKTLQFLGNDVVGDVHHGDWGLQMGMIISELQREMGDLNYFDESYEGDYSEEAPFTLSDLEEIYPKVSKASKEDENVYNAAKQATVELQEGRRGYMALWQQIVKMSLADIKRNYDELNVHFEYWYGESDAQKYIPNILQFFKDKGVLKESQGATVVDVSKEEDKVDIPPIILLKSDGSSMYGTTDIATIYQRIKDFKPDEILYVVDNRQAGHFLQVFRAVEMNGMIDNNILLQHCGFGTMNGKDGKPFKTREGGILRLESLIQTVEDNAKSKIIENIKSRTPEGEDVEINESEVDQLAHIIGIATLKFADLINFRLKDYVFDLEKFSSFEGKTGPYVLYSKVRIKNIMRKLNENGCIAGKILTPHSDVERSLMLHLDKFEEIVLQSAKDRAPNIICEYVYELATLINKFYHNHYIINEPDTSIKESWYSLLNYTDAIMSKGLDLLGIEYPERM